MNNWINAFQYFMYNCAQCLIKHNYMTSLLVLSFCIEMEQYLLYTFLIIFYSILNIHECDCGVVHQETLDYAGVLYQYSALLIRINSFDTLHSQYH